MIFSATLSFAGALRRFFSSSSGPAVTALRVTTRRAGIFPQMQTGRPGGQLQLAASSRKKFFTIRSSSE